MGGTLFPRAGQRVLMTGIVRRLGRRMLGASGAVPSPIPVADDPGRAGDSRTHRVSSVGFARGRPIAVYECASLVIVDGGHAEDVCANDTTLALKLVGRGGVVVWDDYTPYWPGVKSTLEALAGRLSLT